jgi:hypothetical protein
VVVVVVADLEALAVEMEEERSLFYQQEQSPIQEQFPPLGMMVAQDVAVAVAESLS